MLHASNETHYRLLLITVNHKKGILASIIGLPIYPFKVCVSVCACM